MIQNVLPALRVVLYEGTGSQPLTSSERLEIMRSLLQKGYQVTRAVKDGTVSTIRAGVLLVLGQFHDQHIPAMASASELGGDVWIERLFLSKCASKSETSCASLSVGGRMTLACSAAGTFHSTPWKTSISGCFFRASTSSG